MNRAAAGAQHGRPGTSARKPANPRTRSTSHRRWSRPARVSLEVRTSSSVPARRQARAPARRDRPQPRRSPAACTPGSSASDVHLRHASTPRDRSLQGCIRGATPHSSDSTQLCYGMGRSPSRPRHAWGVCAPIPEPLETGLRRTRRFCTPRTRRGSLSLLRGSSHDRRGPGSAPRGPRDAGLGTDERAEPIRPIRRLAAATGLDPCVGTFRRMGGGSRVCRWLTPVIRLYGYRIRAQGHTVIWAPEFYEFPGWVRNADVMFAKAATGSVSREASMDTSIWSISRRRPGDLGTRLRARRSSDAPGTSTREEASLRGDDGLWHYHKVETPKASLTLRDLSAEEAPKSPGAMAAPMKRHTRPTGLFS